jgi:hypothetical protein
MTVGIGFHRRQELPLPPDQSAKLLDIVSECRTVYFHPLQELFVHGQFQLLFLFIE